MCLASLRRWALRVTPCAEAFSGLGDSRRSSREASPQALYDARYYGAGRNPLDRASQSGYSRYTRSSSRANLAAFLVWKHFDAQCTLDVGCALGFVVEALHELGVAARGVDFSAYAIEHAPASVKDSLFVGDLTAGLPLADESFDLISVFEMLEHLPPESVPRALAELRRMVRGHLLATIPSFGPNVHGPSGWFEGKVRWERLAHYRALSPEYDGPVPLEDLLRDAEGRPTEGHLTIASFAWWSRQFDEAGFVRRGDLERRLYPDIDRFGMDGTWNPYVFSVPSARSSGAALRTPREIARVERQLGLDRLAWLVKAERAAGRHLGPMLPRVKSFLKALASGAARRAGGSPTRPSRTNHPPKETQPRRRR